MPCGTLSFQRARRPFWAFLEHHRLSLPRGSYGPASGKRNDGTQERRPSSSSSVHGEVRAGVGPTAALLPRGVPHPSLFSVPVPFLCGARCAALPVLCMSPSDFIPYPITSSSALLSPPHLPAQCRCRTSLVIIVHAPATTVYIRFRARAVVAAIDTALWTCCHHCMSRRIQGECELSRRRGSGG